MGTHVARGFSRIGTLYNRARGFEMNFLRSADTVIEIFTFDEGTLPPAVNPRSRGFGGIGIDGPALPGPVVAVLDAQRRIRLDADGIPVLARA